MSLGRILKTETLDNICQMLGAACSLNSSIFFSSFSASLFSSLISFSSCAVCFATTLSNISGFFAMSSCNSNSGLLRSRFAAVLRPIDRGGQLAVSLQLLRLVRKSVWVIQLYELLPQPRQFGFFFSA